MGNSATKHEQSSTLSPQQSPTSEKKTSHFRKLLSRLQLCPHKSGQMSSKKTKENVPPPKPPHRSQPDKKDENGIKAQEWTEVSLRVPETPTDTLPMSAKHNGKNGGPVPPPRKHKLKIQEILESPKQAKNLESLSPVAVDEPIIVPKKVVEHVCDGHHHHVRNVVNGKVVDQIIEHHNETSPKKSIPPMNKNQSTLSLPSYDELKKKIDKRKKESKKNKSKTSISSNGSEKKSKSNSTAEKLESYMTRCKSFSAILPNHSAEKGKQLEKHSDAESLDSWRGLDDWDVGMIEHEIAKDDLTKTKQEPKKDRESAPPIFEKVKIPENHKHKELNLEPESEVNINKSQVPQMNGNLRDVLIATQNFINNEALMMSAPKKKLAPLAKFGMEDDDIDAKRKSQHQDLLETLQGYCKSHEDKCSPLAQSTPNKGTPQLSNTPKAVPRRKSSKYGHSNLLKFIKDMNASGDENYDNKVEITKTEYHISHKSDSIVTSESDNLEDSEIVPEIKELEASWQRLMKVESDMSSLLETESGIQDLMETSSSDSKSTDKTIK